MRQNEFDYIDEALRELNRRFSHVDQFMGEMRATQEARSESIEELADKLDKICTKMEKNEAKVEGMLNKMNKWESKLGAFMFIAACLWAFFVAMKDQLFAVIKGG